MMKLKNNTFHSVRGSNWQVWTHLHHHRHRLRRLLSSGTTTPTPNLLHLEDKLSYHAVIELAMHRLTVATRYYISRACREARVDAEAFLVAMGKPRAFSTYGMLNWIHYWEMYHRAVTALRMTEEEQDVVRRGELRASSPPRLEGYLLLNLKSLVGIRLLRYLRSHPDLENCAQDRALFIDASLFGLRVVYWVERWMFSREQNFEELCRDARKAAGRWSSLQECYAGGWDGLMGLVSRCSEYESPEVTYRFMLDRAMVEDVIVAGNRVALAGGLDELSLVSLYKFQVDELHRLIKYY